LTPSSNKLTGIGSLTLELYIPNVFDVDPSKVLLHDIAESVSIQVIVVAHAGLNDSC